MTVLETRPATAAATAAESAGKPVGMQVALVGLAHAATLALMAGAVIASRHDSSWGLVLFWFCIVVFIAPTALFLLSPRPGRGPRLFVSLLVGLTPTLIYRMTDPLLFTGFDEQLHLRSLVDISTGHAPLLPQPILPVSPEYPGLESLTSLLRDLTGLSLVGAATLTVILCRLVFAAVLFGVAERAATARIAGVTVAVYATSEQFYFFNAQFAYQTLALVLAVAGVGFVHRARQRPDSPEYRLLMWAAGICLFATAVSHHVTSWLTTLFLWLWMWFEQDPGRRRTVRRAAVVMTLSVAFWGAANYGTLDAYFEPIVTSTADQAIDLIRGSHNNHLFKDGSGVTTPRWEELALVGYAAVVNLTAIVAGLRSLLVARREKRRAPMLLGLTALLLPVMFAFRVLPNAAEYGDRATTFVSLPVAFLVAVWVVARFRSRRVLTVGAALLSFAFLGGIVLGSGPDWERLPGPYLVAADNRSIDPYTLAMAEWAKGNLPLGTRMTADRIGGAVLSAEGRMWPMLDIQTGPDGEPEDPASLYFAPDWGPPQTAEAKALQIGYLYVDERWSDDLPHATVYFHDGEQPETVSPTREDLTKFAQVPGVKVAKRIGPVVIYDIRAVSGVDGITGWTGSVRPPSVWLQLGLGAVLGAILCWLACTPLGRRWRAALLLLTQAAGGLLVSGLALSAVTLVGLALAFTGAAFGPVLGLGALAVVTGVTLARRGLPRLQLVFPGTSVMIVSVLAVEIALGALALAVTSAWHPDITQVRHLLSSGHL